MPISGGVSMPPSRRLRSGLPPAGRSNVSCWSRVSMNRMPPVRRYRSSAAEARGVRFGWVEVIGQ
jgi:hypothetical protein